MNEIDSLETQRGLLVKTKDRLASQIVEKQEMSKMMQELLKRREAGRHADMEIAALNEAAASSKQMEEKARMVKAALKNVASEEKEREKARAAEVSKMGQEASVFFDWCCFKFDCFVFHAI